MGMSSRHGGIEIHVTVKKEELLDRLKTNREQHAKDYENAIQAWQAELKQVLASIDANKRFHFPQELESLRDDCPESHVSEYDRAIDMFTMSTKEEVTLDSDSFNTFCRDAWGWKSYVSQNRFYSTSNSR